MAGSALRRLMAEYKQLTLNPPEGIIAGPINEENFFEWEALITGPEGDDPMGYESSAERWSPVQSVEKILLSVVSMLAEPNDESGANVDAAKMWRENREEFNKIAERIVRRTLGIPT
ncbi:Ubiquitin-conjugating enzyme [Popillia japonica]|uniref:Ubiquitin-conjugating enzyme n=1 Tax=Popillia japonica TaxID=7064 RepID=A0AAW1JG80_POPJA